MPSTFFRHVFVDPADSLFFGSIKRCAGSQNVLPTDETSEVVTGTDFR